MYDQGGTWCDTTFMNMTVTQHAQSSTLHGPQSDETACLRSRPIEGEAAAPHRMPSAAIVASQPEDPETKGVTRFSP